ncbi:MAG: hypothetical protein U9M92_01525 [Patescibacteria group bacterium]|nr:hypothetical protein [Patescibacteria group bacterium]
MVASSFLAHPQLARGQFYEPGDPYAAEDNLAEVETDNQIATEDRDTQQTLDEMSARQLNDYAQEQMSQNNELPVGNPERFRHQLNATMARITQATKFPGSLFEDPNSAPGFIERQTGTANDLRDKLVNGRLNQKQKAIRGTGEESGGGKCGLSNLGQCAIDLLAATLNWILWILSWLMWLAGKAFDIILDVTIRDFGANASSNGVTGAAAEGSVGLGNIPAIRAVWSVLRNLANVVFIFILLFVAIRTILQVKEGESGGLIKNVVLIALLINFSLFFTRVIIDVSNILAVQFYDRVSKTSEGVTEWGISGEFYNRLKLDNAFTPKDQTNASAPEEKTQLSFKQVVINFAGAFVLILLATFVLIAGAVILLIRAITLIVLMILSPAAFAAYAIPEMRKHWDKWLRKLLSEAFLAPFFLFFIFVTFELLGPTTRTAVGADGGWVNQIVYQLLIIGFMFGSLIAAKKLGGATAGSAMKVAGVATGAAVLGGAALAGRNTIGRVATRLSDSDRLKRREEQGGFGGWAARQTLKVSKKTSGASFDVRATKLGGKLGKAAGKHTGLDLGKAGGKGGYTGGVKKKAEKAQKFSDEVLGDKDKAAMEAATTAAVQRREEAAREVTARKADLERIEEFATNPNSSTVKARQARNTIGNYEERVRQAEAKLKTAKKEAEEAPTKARIERKEAYAKRLEEGGLLYTLATFNTKKTRKAMAKKVRDDARESKGNKEAKKMAKLLSDFKKGQEKSDRTSGGSSEGGEGRAPAGGEAS